MNRYNRFTVFRHILRLFKEEHVIISKVQVTCIIILMTFSTAFSAISPYLYSTLVDDVMMKKNIVSLPYMIAFMVGCFIIKSFVDILCSKISFDFNEKMKNQIKQMVLSKILNQQISELNDYDVGEKQKIVEQDSVALQNFFMTHIIKFMCFILYSTVYLYLMCKISLFLTLVAFIIYPLMYFIGKAIGGKFNTIKNTLWKVSSDNNTYLFEVFGKWKEIKSNCLEKMVLDNYKKRLLSEQKINLSWMLFFALNRLTYALKNDFIQKILMYFVGGILIINGQTTVGMLLMFMGYISSFNGYADNIMSSITDFIGEKAVFERMSAVLSHKEKDAVKMIQLQTFDVLINNISYSYPNSEFPIFENANYLFSDHKKHLIMGSSGVGKSTLIKMLSKMIKVSGGQIYIDGKPIGMFSDSEYFKIFGFVLQNETFFNFTINDNLQLINSNATHEDIINACKIAKIHDFILSLPKGYDTTIGERGVKLSGGQRQRLAIARMILHKPSVIVMDEATNSIDSATEKEIFKNLELYFKDKMWIVISHNKKTPIRFDEIITVKEKGLHRQQLTMPVS
mgnify:CR=1 FL=1